MTIYILLMSIVFILQFKFGAARRRHCDCETPFELRSECSTGTAMVVPPAVQCWWIVRGEHYVIRGAEPPTQDEVTETLRDWIQDDTNMTLADAEDVLDAIENRPATARRNRRGCEDPRGTAY